MATFAVAVVPVWAALYWLGGALVGTAAAMAGSLVLTNVGAALWQHHPGSEDVVFGDLMLWSYFRRLRAKQTITKKAQRLGLDASHPRIERTPEQQLRLLKRLAVSLEAGDPYTHGHSQRVARHASMVAKTMHLPRRQREKIRLAGLLHDIGKLYVPSEVLNKPGRLTDEEFDVIKKHPTLGAEIVERLADPELTAMVKHHHERFDGTGYPDRRVGADIPIGARILSVADTFDALTSRRPYRPAQKHRIAIDILKKEAGTQLDRDAVKAFLNYYSGRRTVNRWNVLLGGGTQAWQAAIGWFQRVGLAGVANATLAGTTAVALAATPLVSSNSLRRETPRVRAAVEVAEPAGAETGSSDAGTSKVDISAATRSRRTQGAANKNKQGTDRAKGDKGAQGAKEDDATDKARGKSEDKGNKKDDEVAPEPAPTDGSTPAPADGSVDKGNGKDKKPDPTETAAATDPGDPGQGGGKGPKKP